MFRGEVTFTLVLLLLLAIPSEIPGYLCGYLGVRRRTYLSALALAEFPYAVGAVMLGDGVVNRQIGWLVAFGAMGAAFSLCALWMLHSEACQVIVTHASCQPEIGDANARASPVQCGMWRQPMQLRRSAEP